MGIGGGLDKNPINDLGFFPLGVEDGERGRLDPDEDVDI